MNGNGHGGAPRRGQSAGVRARPDSATSRLRAMRTNQKLQDISEGQRREIETLKKRLVRLQLRSFPSFPVPAVPMSMVSPDMHVDP